MKRRTRRSTRLATRRNPARRSQASFATSAGFEMLEPRNLLAAFAEAGSVLDIDLNVANQVVSIVATPSIYTFTLNSGTWTGSPSPNVSMSGTILTVTNTGLAAFNTINVGDSISAAGVTFANSGSNTYSDNFNVTLDSGPAAAINFNGNSTFTLGNSIYVSTSRNLQFNSGSNLTTVDGNITLQANLQPTPTSGLFTGIDLLNGTIQSTGTGTISVQGRGGNAGNNHGVAMRNGGKLIGSTSGLLTVVGEGGKLTAGAGYGVYVTGAGSSLTSIGGNVSVTGTGGGAGTVFGNNGVNVETAGQISAGDSGSVTVVGHGGNLTGTTGGNNSGVYIYGPGTITSSGGNVSVTGTGGGAGASASNHGVAVEGSGQITAGNNGHVTVVGQGGNLTGTGGFNYGVRVISTGSSITSNGGNVAVTGSGGGNGSGNNNYGISNSAKITAGNYGTVTVVGQGGNLTGTGHSNHGVDITGNNALITSGGGNVSVTGTGGGSGTNSFNLGVNVWFAGQITAGGSGTVTVLGQGGNLTGTGGRNSGVYVAFNNARITSNGGNVAVTGIGGGNGSSAENHGVEVGSSGGIMAGNNGHVTVVGQGGNRSGTGSHNYGVLVAGIGSSIASSGGNVSVSGTGGGSGSAFINNGVYLRDSGRIAAGNNGHVTVVGQGGNSSGTGNSNAGVVLLDAGSSITSSGGNVSVTGTGGGAGASQGNTGISSSGQISAVGSGTVTVVGQGGSLSGTGGSNQGVQLSSTGSSITSGGGNVSVTGTGGGNGTSSFNLGVFVASGGIISAASNGQVTVVGQGGNRTGTGGSINYGVLLAGTGALITSGGGNVAVTGTGGGNGSSADNFGVAVQSSGRIMAGNNGHVTVVGHGGNYIGAGNFNHGVSLLAAGSITSSGGNVSVNGIGSGSSGVAIHVEGGGVISTPASGGTVALVGDSMNLSGGAISTGISSSVSIRQRTSGVAINLDTAGDPVNGPLNLSDAELDRIDTGTINIGDANSGTITFANPISRSALTNMNLSTASSGGVSPSVGGLDLNLQGGTLNIDSGSKLNINIAGSTIDSQYRRLNVNGTADLNGVNLALSGAYVSSPGQIFTIVSATNVVGTFNGLPNNAIVVFNGVNHQVNYSPTSVMLTANPNAPPTVAANLAAVTIAEGNIATNAGTFSDAQGNGTVTISASIGMVTQNNADGTWSWSLNAADGPAGPFTVTITATDDQNAAAMATFTYAVANVPPSIGLSGDATVFEGSPYALHLGNIYDPGQDLIASYEIHWGDGTVESFTGSPANTVALHTYDDGPENQTHSVTVTDEDGNFIAGSIGVQVLNVAPSIQLGGNQTVDEGSEFTLDLGAIYEPGDDSIAGYSIDWGDGHTTGVLAGSPASSTATHTYADGTQTYQIRVTLEDEDGVYDGAGTFWVTVNNVAPSTPVDDDAAADEVTENAANGSAVGISAFSDDPGIDDTVTYSLIDDAGGRFAIDPFTGFITVADGSLLDYEAATSHTITAQASDGEGDSLTQDFTVSLLNQTATISGTVFVDVDGDGLFDGGTETPLDAVIIELFDGQGNLIGSDETEMGGAYAFLVDDEAGTFRIRQTQPTGVASLAAILGTAGGTAISSNEMTLTLSGLDAFDYDFTEQGQAVQAGDSATIGFWQNKNGQALIRTGGTALAGWLSANFGNIFGNTFANGAGGDNGDEVASFYKNEFFKKKVHGSAKVDAQFMATALSTWFTSSNLSGNSVAAGYGFNVTELGLGARVVNIGSSGAAFGVANNTSMTVMALLQATNTLTGANTSGNYSNVYDLNGDGVLDASELALRAMANSIYSWINESGDI